MPIGYREGQTTPVKRDKAGNRVGGGTLVTRKILDAVASDDAVKVEIAENNTEEVKNAINSALVAALVEIGISCERFAKLACPVDTGRLRNSITYAIASSEKAVYVGTNVEYAYSVHEGTGPNRGKGPRRFLKNAAANHKKYYEEILRKHMSGQA